MDQHPCEQRDYPKQFVMDGVTLHLVAESRWLRKFESDDGSRWHITSRLLDGSFDYSWFARLNANRLSAKEKEAAGMALCTSGRRDLPQPWQELADEYRRKHCNG